MIKYLIKGNIEKYFFVFHALPNQSTAFQWYVTEKEKEQGCAIDGQNYESYTFTSQQIEDNDYEGKFLYCEYVEPKTGQRLKTEYVKLHSDANAMIKQGTLFDNISEFDEYGNIIDS